MEPVTTRPWEAAPDRTPRVRTGRGSRVAAVAAVGAAPMATWWLVGADPGGANTEDPSRGLVPSDDHDHLFRPPNIDAGLEQAVGRTASVLFAIALVALAAALLRGSLDRRWVPPLGALVLAGCLVGAGGRVVTAAVVGANIGGGMVLLLGVPAVVALLIGASVWSVDLLRRPTSPGAATPGAATPGRVEA